MVTRKIYLGSQSPRRRELLSLLGVEFNILHGNGPDEVYPASIAPEDVPSFLAELKSDALMGILPDDDAILITADTVVILNGEILGKPADIQEAVYMLTRLAGNTHKVVTGVTLATRGKKKTFSVETLVTFGHLTHEEIEQYVSSARPLDKAGAYGIQEWIGAIGVKEIQGSFYNVMGLPLHRLYIELKEFMQ